jgi:hypothetical protein
MSIVSLVDPIREAFTLRDTERAIVAYAPVQHARIRAHVRAARRRERAGRRVVDAVGASVLLREAVTHYLCAAAVAHDQDARTGELDVVAAMPSLPPDPARPRAEPPDDARVREALATRDPLYFDALSAEDAERTRWALDRAASLTRRRVEARTLANVRATRWGRAAAILVLIGYAAFAIARATLMPKDIALGKPVHPSSRKGNAPDGHDLVDGDIGTSVGVHTNTEDNPNVVIDLQGGYWIDKVKVYNRVDGWFDDCLPLVVELSVDGTKWDEIGRREEHFGTDPPWIVDGGGRRAKQVRLRVARKSYLALSEVEVFGKKE